MIRKLANYSIRSNTQTNSFVFSLKKTPFSKKGSGDQPADTQQRQKKKFLNMKMSNEPKMQAQPKKDKPQIKNKEFSKFSSIFFNQDCIPQGINYEVQSHEFVEQSMKESILHRVSQSQNEKFKAEARAQLDVMEGNYTKALHRYDKVEANKSSPNYLKALSVVNPQRALQVVMQNWEVLKRNITFLQSIFDEACRRQENSTVAQILMTITEKESKGSNFNMKALDYWFQAELQGSFSPSTTDKLNLVLESIKILNARRKQKAYPLQLNFNIKLLTQRLLNNHNLESYGRTILTMLKQFNLFNSSYVDLPKLFEKYIEDMNYRPAFQVLSEIKDRQDIDSLVFNIRSRYLSGNLLIKLFQENLQQFYVTVTKENNPHKAVLCLKIAHAILYDKMIFQMYHRSNQSESSPLLNEAYLDAVIRIPTTQHNKVLDYIKGITSQPEPAIKSKIIAGDYKSAFMIFRGQILDKVVQDHQKEHLRHFLYTIYGMSETITEDTKKEVDTLIKDIEPGELWQLYREHTDYDELLKLYLPKDHHSFWEETFNNRSLSKLKQLKENGKLEQHSLSERQKKMLPKLDKFIESESKRDDIKRDVQIYLLEMEALIESAKCGDFQSLTGPFQSLVNSASPEVINVLKPYGLCDIYALADQYEFTYAVINRLRANDYEYVQILEKNVLLSPYPQENITNIFKYATNNPKIAQQDVTQSNSEDCDDFVTKGNIENDPVARLVASLPNQYPDQIFDSQALAMSAAYALRHSGYKLYDQDPEKNDEDKDDDKEEQDEEESTEKDQNDISHEQMMEYIKDLHYMGDVESLNVSEQIKESIRYLTKERNWGAIWKNIQAHLQKALEDAQEEGDLEEGVQDDQQGIQEGTAEGATEGAEVVEAAQGQAQNIEDVEASQAVQSEEPNQLVQAKEDENPSEMKLQGLDLDALEQFEAEPSAEEQGEQVDINQLQLTTEQKQLIQQFQSDQSDSSQISSELEDNQDNLPRQQFVQLSRPYKMYNLRLTQEEVANLPPEIGHPQIFTQLRQLAANDEQVDQVLDIHSSEFQSDDDQGEPIFSLSDNEFMMKEEDSEEAVQLDYPLVAKTLDLQKVHYLKESYEQLWKGTRTLVELVPNQQVQSLIMWGITHKQPMAVYMGEMVASLTKQKISHPVALQVGKFLSQQRSTDKKIIEKAKKALELLGPIKRDHIYNFNYKYEHIDSNSDYLSYLSELLELQGHPLTDNIKRQMLKKPLRWQTVYDTDFSIQRYIKERASQINAP